MKMVQKKAAFSGALVLGLSLASAGVQAQTVPEGFTWLGPVSGLSPVYSEGMSANGTTIVGDGENASSVFVPIVWTVSGGV